MRTKTSAAGLGWMSLALVACGGTSGARPHDMSTSGHEQAAESEEAEAEQHEAEYDATAQRALRCGSGRASAEAGGACWTTDVNPTDEHRAEAEQHRRAAADHRAGAQALRDAEAQACIGIDEVDRDTSPFAHREDIASVAPLTERVRTGRQERERVVGARVVFRAVPGMTPEWLQRLVDCHLARAASVGPDMPEMGYCPLVPSGASARVSSTGDGFAVDVRGADDTSAQQIVERARALTTAP